MCETLGHCNHHQPQRRQSRGGKLFNLDPTFLASPDLKNAGPKKLLLASGGIETLSWVGAGEGLSSLGLWEESLDFLKIKLSSGPGQECVPSTENILAFFFIIII